MPDVTPSGVPDEYRLTLPPLDPNFGQIERTFNTLPFVQPDRATCPNVNVVVTATFIADSAYVVGAARTEGGTYARTGYMGCYDYSTNTTTPTPAFQVVGVDRLTTYHLTGRFSFFQGIAVIANYPEATLNIYRDNTLWEKHLLGLVMPSPGGVADVTPVIPVDIVGTFEPGYRYSFDLDARKATGAGTLYAQLNSGWHNAAPSGFATPTTPRTHLNLLTW